jgi:hypothetical protein
MTADDSPSREIEAFGKAVRALAEACVAIAEHYDACPLCLMLAVANIAQETEEAGEHHCGIPQQTHPTHKTIV